MRVYIGDICLYPSTHCVEFSNIINRNGEYFSPWFFGPKKDDKMLGRWHCSINDFDIVIYDRID